MGLYRTLPKPIAWPPPGTNADIADALRYTRLRDPVGHHVHTIMALIYLFLLPLITAPKDVAFVILGFYTLVRLPNTWRCYTPFLRMPLMWAYALWAGWTALSMTWSVDPGQGFRDFGPMRMLLTPVLLWPVIDRLPWLIGAPLVGVAGQQVAQFLEYFDLTNMRPQDDSSRMGGWIHPTQTGTWCMAAICWHVSAVLTRSGKIRAISAVLLVLALGGLVVAQSRGPWVAVAITIPLLLITAAWKHPSLRKTILWIVVVGIVASAASWPWTHSVILPRIQKVQTEVCNALEQDEYWTDIGLKLGQWQWSWAIYKQHPIHGVGVGSFRQVTSQLPEFQDAVQKARDCNPSLVARMERDHTHNMYLQTLASAGTVGGILLLAVIIFHIRQCIRDRKEHAYALGTLFILIGWLIGALFDCHEQNGHLMGLLALIGTITMTGRAPARKSLAAGSDEEAAEYTQTQNERISRARIVAP